MNELLNISPIDGRYHSKMEELQDSFSEYALIKQRVFVEIIELPEHKQFIAGQFHPEFKSRPMRAHPLFLSFIKASIANKQTLLRRLI